MAAANLSTAQVSMARVSMARVSPDHVSPDHVSRPCPRSVCRRAMDRGTKCDRRRRRRTGVGRRLDRRGRRDRGRGSWRRDRRGRSLRAPGRLHNRPQLEQIADSAKLSDCSGKTDQNEAAAQSYRARQNQRSSDAQLIDRNTESQGAQAHPGDHDTQDQQDCRHTPLPPPELVPPICVPTPVCSKLRQELQIEKRH